jgi:hypothetical membrane protein
MIFTRVKKVRRLFYAGIRHSINMVLILKIWPFLKKCNIHTVLAVAGIIGPIFLIIGDLSAGLSSPGYSIIQNSISSLALTNIGWLQTIGFLALGLLVEGFTAGLLFNMKGAKRFYLAITLFVFFGFAMLLVGAFATDPVGAERTIEGRIHGFMASTAFLLFPVGLILMLPSIKKDPKWKALYRYSFITFIVAVALMVVVKFLPEENFLFGLLERLLVANMILWVEVSAVNIFIISLKRNQKQEVKQYDS